MKIKKLWRIIPQHYKPGLPIHKRGLKPEGVEVYNWAIFYLEIVT